MAVLDATNRLRVGNQWMRLGRTVLGTCAFTKTDLRAAVDATDAWIEANQAAFNAALPAGFRNNATLVQKTLLFWAVAARRAGLFRAEEDG
jgi:hypothetical protein